MVSPSGLWPCRFTFGPRGVEIEVEDAQPDDQIGPRAAPQVSGDQRGTDHRQVGERVIARRQPGRNGQTAARAAMPGQDDSGQQVDRQRPKCRHGKDGCRRRDRVHQFCDRHPKRHRSGNEQDQRQGDTNPFPRDRRPTQRKGDQDIDRAILEKVDVVGKQRYRPDAQRGGKFDQAI